MSTGFTSVGTENTIALVDVTINLLHELSDLCPEDQTQETLRGLLRGMSAALSDRASVMKSFGGLLDEERWRILRTDEELQLLYCNVHNLLGLGTACHTVLMKMEKEGGQRLGRDRLTKIQECLRKCCFKASTNILLVQILRLCIIRNNNNYV